VLLGEGDCRAGQTWIPGLILTRGPSGGAARRLFYFYFGLAASCKRNRAGAIGGRLRGRDRR
jgi:hypothetical protein